MSDLAAFQDAFAQAMRGEADLAAFGPDPAVAAGLSVYRNTSMKGAVDALRGNFPAVERLVGEDWFADVARLYAASRPPASPVLLDYGEGFPAFLGDFPPAKGLPYLADVALFDWLWIEAHVAADAPAFTARDAAAIAPEALFAMGLTLHPSARLAWSDQPAATIWSANRAGADDCEVGWRGEGLILVRPDGEVMSRILDLAAFTFLAAIRDGQTLGEAATAALSTDPAFDLGPAFADLLNLGAFEKPKTTQ